MFSIELRIGLVGYIIGICQNSIEAGQRVLIPREVLVLLVRRCIYYGAFSVFGNRSQSVRVTAESR